MANMSPFRINVSNLGPEIIGPPSNPKKRRKNNQVQQQQQIQPQDLLPPTPSGYGDTIVASNPFDDCPSSINMNMNRGPPMGPMGMPPNSMACSMGMGRPPMGGMGPMGAPMMHSPNAMGPNGMMSVSPRMGGHMGPGGPHPHMLNSPNGPGPGGPMHPGMTGPPMHSPIGGMGMGGPMQGSMGSGGCGPMNSPIGNPMNGLMNGGGPNNQMNNGPINGPMSSPLGMNGPMNGPGGPMSGGHNGPPMNNNNFMMNPMNNTMYSKPMPVSAGKIYPVDQSMIFNAQNRNAPPIYPCGVCHKEVHDNDQAILCESGCNFWYHRGCAGLTEQAFQLLNAEVYAEWVCDKCLSTKNIPLVKLKP